VKNSLGETVAIMGPVA